MHYRRAFLEALVLLGAATVFITEAASAIHRLDRVTVATAWAILLCAAVWASARRISWPAGIARLSLFDSLSIAAIAAIAAIIGVTALISPPNSADAMAYHLPRVIYWMQARSVAFFPTPYLNQIMLQPVAEYLMLHTLLLSGGDRFVNLVQFVGFTGSVAGVSCIAGELGLPRRGQIFAALFCATIPNGILQASGAKNDYLLSLWLVAMILFVIRAARGGWWRDLVFLGLGTGLALGTKATAYLFAPPLAVAACFAAGGWPSAPVRALAAMAAGTLLINAPQFARNRQLSGSILGYDSAQGDGAFRWRNEYLGWKPAVSNLLRNTADQVGARADRWNQAVYAAVLRAHLALGIDPQDPGTTWRWSSYGPPRNSNHEADANNRWHLLLIAIGLVAAAVRRRIRWLWYGLGLAVAFVAFCFYLKWQPFGARLELPLFVAASPLAGALLAGLRSVILQTVLCLFLVTNARLPLLQNWTRPLAGPNSLLATPRDRNYFNDMSQWHNRGAYFTAVERTAASRCELVGIDISRNQLEYPFQALVREKNPRVRFVHVGVANTSLRYSREIEQPCAVFCPDCADIPEKVAAYGTLGDPIVIDRFLLFLRK